jgi:hypothetical protein
MHRWRVDIIRKRAEHLGTVEAATEKEAIEKAAEQFDIRGSVICDVGLAPNGAVLEAAPRPVPE